ncbi:MAG: hypothetical protein ACFE85_08975 [Candidatus Hodarchaeota archaeon]
MKSYKVIIVFFIVFILTLLSFIFNQYFLFVPIICVIPFSCRLSRRSERDYQHQITYSPQSQEFKRICPFCEKEIIEKNLRFCPNCGTKI